VYNRERTTRDEKAFVPLWGELEGGGLVQGKVIHTGPAVKESTPILDGESSTSGPKAGTEFRIKSPFWYRGGGGLIWERKKEKSGGGL